MTIWIDLKTKFKIGQLVVFQVNSYTPNCLSAKGLMCLMFLAVLGVGTFSLVSEVLLSGCDVDL